MHVRDKEARLGQLAVAASVRPVHPSGAGFDAPSTRRVGIVDRSRARPAASGLPVCPSSDFRAAVQVCFPLTSSSNAAFRQPLLLAISPPLSRLLISVHLLCPLCVVAVSRLCEMGRATTARPCGAWLPAWREQRAHWRLHPRMRRRRRRARGGGGANARFALSHPGARTCCGLIIFLALMIVLCRAVNGATRCERSPNWARTKPRPARP